MQLDHLVALGPALSALASSLLAFLTFFTVRASRAMAREMYETRLAQFRPVLYPVLRREADTLLLHLRNVGPGPAMDIDISCKGDFDRQCHLPFFGPGEKTDLPLSDRSDREGTIKISICYMDLFGNRVETLGRYRLTQENTGDGYIYSFDTRMRGGLHCR
ncbi:MAG: hypothetical protein QME76_00075 [Bacillota bacterium]|nr:hypothetical protein [Bacillota bacterium]